MHAIEAAALTRTYGKDTVVEGVDLLVPPGQVHALLGPNGSGKTTTVRMLATLADGRIWCCWPVSTAFAPPRPGGTRVSC
ncbi:ATP-binding cassette domain-containing protein [Nocardia salmonicida]|uniref:ATP-binding cassette domain-containing protein n=1 Tax=Nocardia salmonicida TaxID=53431 RepID=A0ABZ1N4F4_9NOCA